MLKRLNELVSDKKDFAFETTLASRFYARWLSGLQSAGYHFHLIYLWLKNPELAIERVRERVRAGGHNIPEETVKRRFERGMNRFVFWIEYKNIKTKIPIFETQEFIEETT